MNERVPIPIAPEGAPERPPMRLSPMAKRVSENKLAERRVVWEIRLPEPVR